MFDCQKALNADANYCAIPIVVTMMKSTLYKNVCEKESNGGGKSIPATHSACMERQIYYPVYNGKYCIRFGTCSFKRQFNGFKVFYIYFKHFAFVGTDE